MNAIKNVTLVALLMVGAIIASYGIGLLYAVR